MMGRSLLLGDLSLPRSLGGVCGHLDLTVEGAAHHVRGTSKLRLARAVVNLRELTLASCDVETNCLFRFLHIYEKGHSTFHRRFVA